ncbi:hypothetical protein BJX76DRAFT_342875, partial [Aspergillus varians]
MHFPPHAEGSGIRQRLLLPRLLISSERRFSLLQSGGSDSLAAAVQNISKVSFLAQPTAKCARRSKAGNLQPRCGGWLESRLSTEAPMRAIPGKGRKLLRCRLGFVLMLQDGTQLKLDHVDQDVQDLRIVRQSTAHQTSRRCLGFESECRKVRRWIDLRNAARRAILEMHLESLIPVRLLDHRHGVIGL